MTNCKTVRLLRHVLYKTIKPERLGESQIRKLSDIGEWIKNRIWNCAVFAFH